MSTAIYKLQIGPFQIYKDKRTLILFPIIYKTLLCSHAILPTVSEQSMSFIDDIHDM